MPPSESAQPVDRLPLAARAHAGVCAALLIAGLLIAGAILWSAPRYALVPGGGDDALRLDSRTGAADGDLRIVASCNGLHPGETYPDTTPLRAAAPSRP